jgi:ABC-type phosphate/phosphonate transport system substrate-binding protein
MSKGGIHARIMAAAILLAAGIGWLGSAGRLAAGDKNADGVRIGMVNSLFRDVPEATLSAMMKPFSSVMESQTGVRGELVPGGEMSALGDQMAADKIQLGVFHGIEFAWVRLKHPELKPLAIAVNQDRHVRALLVVRIDNAAADALPLHDQVLAMPQQSNLHCHLFADKCCDASHKRAAQFFSRVSTPPNAEEALDDVVDKEATATIVDAVAFDSFKRRKPGRAGRQTKNQVIRVRPRRKNHDGSQALASGLHSDRTTGGHQHYRDSDRPAPAGRPKSPGGCQSHRLHQQSEANRSGDAQLPQHV